MLAAISRGVAFVQGGDAGPLGGTYRLSGLLLMGGFLFVEVLGDIGVPGEAVAMSGFLSLIVVMVSLFLVMGKTTGRRRRHIRAGFAALILGEFMGLVVGNFFDIAFFGSAPSISCAPSRLMRLDRLPLPVHRARLLSALASCHHARSLRCHVPQDQQTSRAFPP